MKAIFTVHPRLEKLELWTGIVRQDTLSSDLIERNSVALWIHQLANCTSLKHLIIKQEEYLKFVSPEIPSVSEAPRR